MQRSLAQCRLVCSILSLRDCNDHFNLNRTGHGVRIGRVLHSLCIVKLCCLISRLEVLIEQSFCTFEFELIEEVVIVNASDSTVDTIIDG